MTALEELISKNKKIDRGGDQSTLIFQTDWMMSEELTKKGYEKTGTIIGNYEYFDLGDSTINQLKKARIIPNRDYRKYGKRKPDGLLVDRRDNKNVIILCVIEHKDISDFDTEEKRKSAVEQCNDLCQELDAQVGIATDYSSFIWFNPNETNNAYRDKTTKKKRGYTLVKKSDGNDLIEAFDLRDQKSGELDINKLEYKARQSIQLFDTVRTSLSKTNSVLRYEPPVDPTDFAKQIWQIMWMASGESPDKCLLTFVELFIFKYLSDLNILKVDNNGTAINFKDIIALDSKVAFKNYTAHVRKYMKTIFPPVDGTTIINGGVIDAEIEGHETVFFDVLKKFEDFKELKNIDPNFKSKVFEHFMKGKAEGVKNLGRFFTPRNVIDAMIKISGIDELANGSQICDPACGVGGFILDSLKLHSDGINFYYPTDGKEIKPKHNFIGYDIGTNEEGKITTILAKANMLIFLSDVLKNNPNLINKFSPLLGKTFKSLTAMLGSLSVIEYDKYDLILTNPPYGTRGIGVYKKAIEENDEFRKFYKINGGGKEGLFLEWIIRSLKPNRKAFVIIPDGLLIRLNDDALRKFVKDECIIDAIISLPIQTFYTTPKKTYILAITKKPFEDEKKRWAHNQTEPVFTYLVSEIGESRNSRRLPIEQNDLEGSEGVVELFNQFKGAKNSFKSSNPRCKIIPIDNFNPKDTTKWAVDRLWTQEEKVALGIEDEIPLLTKQEFEDFLQEKKEQVLEAIEDLQKQLKD